MTVTYYAQIVCVPAVSQPQNVPQRDIAIWRRRWLGDSVPRIIKINIERLIVHRLAWIRGVYGSVRPLYRLKQQPSRTREISHLSLDRYVEIGIVFHDERRGEVLLHDTFAD